MRWIRHIPATLLLFSSFLHHCWLITWTQRLWVLCTPGCSHPTNDQSLLPSDMPLASCGSNHSFDRLWSITALTNRSRFCHVSPFSNHNQWRDQLLITPKHPIGGSNQPNAYLNPPFILPLVKQNQLLVNYQTTIPVTKSTTNHPKRLL